MRERNTTPINWKNPDTLKRSLQFHPCIQQLNIMQLPCQPVSRLLLLWWKREMLLGYRAIMRSPNPALVFPSSNAPEQESFTPTHRDVKELLGVVQHADPDGDVSPRGHGRGSVPGVQRADAKSLRGPKTLPCSRGHWLWVWLCHDAPQCSLPSLHRGQERRVRQTHMHM